MKTLWSGERLSILVLVKNKNIKSVVTLHDKWSSEVSSVDSSSQQAGSSIQG